MPLPQKKSARRKVRTRPGATLDPDAAEIRAYYARRGYKGITHRQLKQLQRIVEVVVAGIPTAKELRFARAAAVSVPGDAGWPMTRDVELELRLGLMQPEEEKAFRERTANYSPEKLYERTRRECGGDLSPEIYRQQVDAVRPQVKKLLEEFGLAGAVLLHEAIEKVLGPRKLVTVDGKTSRATNDRQFDFAFEHARRAIIIAPRFERLKTARDVLKLKNLLKAAGSAVSVSTPDSSEDSLREQPARPRRDRSGYVQKNRLGKVSLQVLVEPAIHLQFKKIADGVGVPVSELMRHLVQTTIAHGTDPAVEAAITAEKERAEAARANLLATITPKKFAPS